MTESTNTAPTTDPAEEAINLFVSTLAAIRARLASPLSPVDRRVTVTCHPEEVKPVLTPSGVEIVNDIVFTLGDRSASISPADIATCEASGGNFFALMMAKVTEIGGYTALTDAMIIRALLHRLGGEVTLDEADLTAARAATIIVQDGVTFRVTEG